MKIDRLKHFSDSPGELRRKELRERCVCKIHFNDYAIQNFIRRNGSKGNCHYCGRKSNVVLGIVEVGEFIQDGLYGFYSDAAEWLPYESAEGGYQGEFFFAFDILTDHLELVEDNELIRDLVFLLPDHVWCHYDPFGDTESEILKYDWNDFKEIIKHKSRYTIFFQEKEKYERFKVKVSDILLEVGRRIGKFHLVKELKIGTKLFRCRQHNGKKKIYKAKEMAAPPKNKAVYSNRMSPAGISMFYCTFDVETAEIETIDPNDVEKRYFSVASFTTKHQLRVVDFSKLPRFPSIFDKKTRLQYHSIKFLYSFVRDLAEPIEKDGKEHIEYVPTQVVTEYIRFMMKSRRRIDGIVYPSSKKRNKRSCVLFLDHEESLNTLRFDAKSIITKRVRLDEKL